MVVELDVQHHRDSRPQERQAAVRLVRLGDQQRPAAGPGVASQLRDVATDQIGGVEAQAHRGVGRHRRAGRLAVGAGHADRAPRGDHLGQQLGTVEPGKRHVTGGQQLRLLRADGR